MGNMGRILEEKYNSLFQKYDLEEPLDTKNINQIIKHSLRDFLKDAKNPAIYCNGGHTNMLMADFIYELKNVKYIVDNFAKREQGGGFSLIRDEDMEAERIDAVILSTYKFRKDLKQKLAEKHVHIRVLDIYDEFEKNGIPLYADYYYSNHPYHHYQCINRIQREISETSETEQLKLLYEKLITKYLHIKDFRTASLMMKEYLQLFPSKHLNIMYRDLQDLYELQQQAVESVSEKNVLMLCLDGLRRQDLSKQGMPKIKRIFDNTAYNFTNAYSFSTSTFESLIPVYSENDNLQTRYFEKNTVDEADCRFVKLAKQQNREIYIYGDMEHFIEGEGIHYSTQFLTVTEKLWQFVLDACETENGLFYIHELYESHFTFSNPYTEAPLKSEGTAMLFDFLPAKGGKLRADYKTQHRDAVKYLDDVLEPFLAKLPCRMVVYADHGNLILEQDVGLEAIKDADYTCSEEWTRIPIAIRSPEEGTGENNNLISLMELNSMIVSLLMGKSYMRTAFREFDHIKLARSELYNPDFRYLYKMIEKEQYLQAFECFIFESGYKLLVFENGYVELRSVRDDSLIENEEQKKQFLNSVQKQITVCNIKNTEVKENYGTVGKRGDAGI